MGYIDCKKYATEILDAVKAVPNKGKLVIFTAGDDPASASYVRGKKKDCEYCGIPYEHIVVESEEELNWQLAMKRVEEGVAGIIVQLPLPEGWDESYFTGLVPNYLDVDGFNARSKFKPCTAEGIIHILHKELGNLAGMDAVVVGRGNLVGRPVAKMLLHENCTVTVAHSKTRNLSKHLCQADIVVTGVNVPHVVNLAQCGAFVVVDAGISKGDDGKLHGNCYGEVDSLRLPQVTPVPGGVGLLTRAILMAHVARLDVNEL